LDLLCWRLEAAFRRAQQVRAALIRSADELTFVIYTPYVIDHRQAAAGQLYLLAFTDRQSSRITNHALAAVVENQFCCRRYMRTVKAISHHLTKLFCRVGVGGMNGVGDGFQ